MKKVFKSFYSFSAKTNFNDTKVCQRFNNVSPLLVTVHYIQHPRSWQSINFWGRINCFDTHAVKWDQLQDRECLRAQAHMNLMSVSHSEFMACKHFGPLDSKNIIPSYYSCQTISVHYIWHSICPFCDLSITPYLALLCLQILLHFL